MNLMSANVCDVFLLHENEQNVSVRQRISNND